MGLTEIFLAVVALLLCGLIALTIVNLRRSSHTTINAKLDAMKTDNIVRDAALRQELSSRMSESVNNLGGFLIANIKSSDDSREVHLKSISENLKSSQSSMQQTLNDRLLGLEGRFATFSSENELKLENIRTMTERRLSAMQQDNNLKLDEMRSVVDEKLQKTLEERITRSFGLVSERLDMVSKGLGEMQSLATGVGDLKKVLSNVKTRGTLGEIQLQSILTEILSNEQYECNVVTKSAGNCPVEFAVKLPCEDEGYVFLPIDSKFPADVYAQLSDAYEEADKLKVAAASSALVSRLKSMAKDIHDKYIDPPRTTDFAIMFLPTEGLYAEAVKLGMISTLQSAYRVNIAGPSTMAALLNSLQMGFRTFAIQKRSGEVWNVLSAVKTEFVNFASALEATQKHINIVSEDLDKMVGVRTRQIQRKLKNVETIDYSDAKKLLEGESDD